MKLLAVDAGTTHCKAGLFDEMGRLLAVSSRPTPLRTQGAYHSYDPEELWLRVAAAIADVTAHSKPEQIGALGVSSMAETGLLLSTANGAPRTSFVPWFDTRTIPQTEQIARDTDVAARFRRTGMRPTFKSAVMRLLWLRQQDAGLLSGAVWLSVADYLAFRLTGRLATDHSLAGRTYAYHLQEGQWDTDWLGEWKLGAGLFPAVQAAGSIVGQVTREGAASAGLLPGTPVTIAGHDHVCAAFAAYAIGAGTVFDSMGTAETLLGVLDARDLQEADFGSGFTFGRHVIPGAYYWMGGLSTSGGSVEWLRAVLGEPPLTYEALESLLETVPVQPTGILYFPYLAGSGSPHSNDRMRGVFAGLQRDHGRGHLLRAILEGTAYEMEWIRQAATTLGGVKADRLVAGGGGTRNRHWLQIKADVSGLPIVVLAVTETTLLGAALLAGMAGGAFETAADALAVVRRQRHERFEPHKERHRLYRRLFENGYRPLQEPLRYILPPLTLT